MNIRKFFFVTSMIAAFTAQTAAPALAWQPDHSSGHGYRKGHHDGHFRGDDHRRDRGHDRRRDRGHDRHTNFSVFVGQSYGPGWGHGYGPGWGHRPAYYPANRSYTPGYSSAGNNSLFGALIGGGVGGIAGSHVGKGDGRTAAIIGGTLIGALFGSNVGRAMTPYDHGHAAQVFEATPSNQTIAWQNPDYGTAYQVTPVRTFQVNDGRYCREYQALATVGGRQERTYGTACRTPDGDWQIMN